MTLIVHGYTKIFYKFLKTSFEIKNDSAFPNGYLYNNWIVIKESVRLCGIICSVSIFFS